MASTVPQSSPEISARLLLVGSDLNLLANISLSLTAASYRVTTANSYRDVLLLHRKMIFSFAVVVGAPDPLEIKSVAEYIRRQWPSARILVSKSAQEALNDPLFDETVDSCFHPQDILDALARLSGYGWTQRAWSRGASNGAVERASGHLQFSRSAPPESDPTKVPHRYVAEEANSRERPAGESIR